MPITLKAVNGSTTRLATASGYLFFQGGDTDEWLDKTVSVRNVSSFSLPQWMAEFERLKKVNVEIMGGTGGKQAAKKKRSKVGK